VRRPVRHLIVVVLVAAAIAGCSDDPDEGDVDRALTEEAFLETCAPGRTPLEERVCRCAFERVADDLTYDELERLDRNLRDDPDDVPPEVTEAALECAAEPLTPATDRPSSTTTEPDEETTTTERDP
jgi:hypothetical protein